MSNEFNSKYSVLFPLYIKDRAEWFIYAMDSMLNQTVKPDEVVIVGDGKLTEELDNAIKNYVNQYPELFKVKIFEQNRGLGKVLADGVNLCSNELIARMDADDYSMPTRCEEQLKILQENPEIDLVGTNVDEFYEEIGNVVAHVVLPENHNEIYKFAKKRCPIRHPSLMYKKSKVLESGNYRDFWHGQDYNLTVHMLLHGCKMYNIQKVLVYMRVNPNFYARRGGVRYMKIILKLKKEFLDYGFYSIWDFIVSGIGSALVCLLPNKMREFIYKKLLRK